MIGAYCQAWKEQLMNNVSWKKIKEMNWAMYKPQVVYNLLCILFPFQSSFKSSDTLYFRASWLGMSRSKQPSQAVWVQSITIPHWMQLGCQCKLRTRRLHWQEKPFFFFFSNSGIRLRLLGNSHFHKRQICRCQAQARKDKSQLAGSKGKLI